MADVIPPKSPPLGQADPPVEDAIPRNRLKELFDWLEKGRTDQAEESLRRRVELLQAPLEKQFGGVREGHEMLSDRIEKLESERMSELREHQSELAKQVRDLENRQLSDELHAKQWQFLTKYALPILGALIFALFAWVWNSHSTLVQVQGVLATEQERVAELNRETKDRYPRKKADEDFRYLEEKIGTEHEKLFKHLIAMDARLRTVEQK